MITAQIKQMINGLLEADELIGGMVDNYSIYPQTWPSTTLGFSGIGGSMMTTAPTTAIEADGKIYVFFGRSFAYSRKTEELPEGLYSRIFYQQCAPSVKEFSDLVKNKSL